ncbi:MAG: MFS transporter [Prochlorotrichaceae cyanobacterium]
MSASTLSASAQPTLSLAVTTDPRIAQHEAWTKFTILAASALAILPSAAVAPALPALQTYFATLPNSTGSNWEQWFPFFLSLPSLAILLGSVPAGYLSDRWGRRPLLLGSLLLFIASGSAGMFLTQLPWLFATRITLGFAVAGAMTPLIALVGDYFNDRTRAILLGWQSGSIGLAGVLVSGASGVLADWNWRFCFALYCIPLLLLPLVWWYLPEPDVQKRDLPAPASDPSQGSDRRGSVPWTTLLTIYGIETLHMVCLFVTPVQLPFYFQQRLGLPAILSGLAIGALSLTQAITSLLYNQVRQRLKLNFWGIVGLAFGLASLGSSVIAIAPNAVVFLCGLGLTGCGFGLLYPNSKLWITEIVPQASRGRALGGLVAAFDLGVFLSPFFSQSLVQFWGLPLTYEAVSLALVSLGSVSLFQSKSCCKT